MTTEDFSITDKNRVKRSYKRASYKKETIYQILDSSALAHVAYVIDNTPFCTPTTHWREGDTLYWHGSSASRMIKELKQGVDVCVTVSRLDGFVLARSAFHHSVNYRSAMCFGKATLVSNDEEKCRALNNMIERFFPKRTDEMRAIAQKELKATSVIKMEIDVAAAKMRASGPNDDEEDYATPIWAGVIPVTTIVGSFQPDDRLEKGGTPPESLNVWMSGKRLDDVLNETQQIYIDRLTRPKAK